MKNNTYKIDYTTNTMTITKAFERAANNPYSEEYELLRKIKTDFPNMKIVRKTSAARRHSSPYKGLTYDAMERYIRANRADLMGEFETVKSVAAIMPNSYLYVRNWFVERFPEWMADRWNKFDAVGIEAHELKVA